MPAAAAITAARNLVGFLCDSGLTAHVDIAIGQRTVIFASKFLFHVLVSEDVPLDDPRLMLWGWFTRFDPVTDTHPARREQVGNRLNLHAPLCIDAAWKEGYRQPVAFDPECLEKVEKNWDSYGINL